MHHNPADVGAGTPSTWADGLADLLKQAAQLRASGDAAGSLRLAQGVYGQAREADVPGLVADALFELGTSERQLANYAGAILHLEEARHLHHTTGNLAGEAQDLNGLGNVYSDRGDLDAAVLFYGRALDLRRTLQDRYGEARVLINLGLVLNKLRSFDEAISLLEQALPVFRERGDATGEAAVLTNIGIARLERNTTEPLRSAGLATQEEDLLEAERCFRTALNICRRVGLSRDELKLLGNLGSVLIRRQQPEHGVAVLGEGLRLAEERGVPVQRLLFLLNLGEAHLALGDPDRAAQLLNEALTLADEVGRKDAAYHAHLYLCSAYRGLGQFEQALHHHQEYHRLEREVLSDSARWDSERLVARLQAERTEHEAQLLRQHAAELERVNARLREVDEQRTALFAQLAHQAEHDSLTGLPVRAPFEAELQRRVLGARRAGRWLVLTLIVLHDLPALNARYGRDETDGAIAELARRLAGHLGEGESAARLGGGEFAALLAATGPGDAERVGHDLLRALTVPFVLAGHRARLDVTLGLALYPRDAPDARGLLRRAEQVLPTPVPATRGRPKNPAPAAPEPVQSETAGPVDLSILTPREREVLVLVARGQGNGPIGEQLGMSERTVRFHVSALLAKFEVTSRAQLIALAAPSLRPPS